MNADRDLCINNLYILAKKKGLRICDLETSCGVSVGYLARLRKDKNNSLPGADFLVRAASLLETSVDSLLFFDYHLATDTEIYLHLFVSRLTLDSLSEKLVWQLDPACVPSPVEADSAADLPDHPLLSFDPRLMEQRIYKEIFLSPFHPMAYDLQPRAAYRAPISEDSLVLLVRVASPQSDQQPDAEEEVELFLYNTKAKALSPLCCADGRHSGVLDHALSTLAQVVSESVQRTKLDHFAVSAIDAYMNAHNRK